MLLVGTAAHALALALSLLLHLGVAMPWVAWRHFSMELDSPGEEGTEPGQAGNDGGELVSLATPVQVSLYKEPRKSRPPAEKPPTTDQAGAGGVPSGGEGGPTEAVESAAPTGAVAERRVLREGVQGKPPRGKKKPCEPIEEVVALGEDRWRIERDLMDWYATHLRELEKQVGVSSHRGDDGKRDGARLYLPRCSVLRQGGLLNGDVIHTVNGRKVNTVAQGVATWLAVRNNKTIVVELSRKDGTPRTHTYKLK